MCGIGGYQLKNNVEAAGSRAMLSTLQEIQHHRGPDGKGQWVNATDRLGFCHTRLAIVDLTASGAQPMTLEDGQYTITFNGEIYNWQALRDELAQDGTAFQSRSDTEVILVGYRKWGYDILQKLRGMYAFALWDNVKKSLFCARDPIGKKPFIYGEGRNGFFFASEISALTAIGKAAGLDTEIDKSGMANMLLHNMRHICEPCTAFKGIKKLRPGHAVIVEKGRIQKMWRHWTPTPYHIDTPGELRAVLEKAVALRSMADVPVGALLSGGIDSSAIVNLMQRQTKAPVNTYAFGRDKNDEDLHRARLMARQLGTRHKEFYFNPHRQMEILKKILKSYGEPIMLLPLIHSFELSEAIFNDGIKVVLNGNGADELFYGYTGHLNTARITRILNMLGWVRHVMPRLKRSRLSLLTAPPGKRKAVFYRLKAEASWPRILHRDIVDSLDNVAEEEMRLWGRLCPNRDFIDESNYLALLIENSHSLTTASDLPGMMASVEMRSPFLDRELISAAMGIHFTKKVKGPKDGRRLKHILREAVKDLMPPEILNAPKRGFGMGIQEKDVLLGPWRRDVDTVFSEYPDLGLFDTARVRALWESAKTHGKGEWNLLAKLFSIGLWWRTK